MRKTVFAKVDENFAGRKVGDILFARNIVVDGFVKV